MVAERRGPRRVLAGTEAELVSGDEILFCEKVIDEPSVAVGTDEPGLAYRPLVHLLELARKSGREYKTSDRITWSTRQQHTIWNYIQ